MSSRDVVGLIPDRDSDSSDDEFLDALEKIENEPDELGPENGIAERQSIASGNEVEVDGGPCFTSERSVTSPQSATSRKSVTSQQSVTSQKSVTSSQSPRSSATSTPSSTRNSIPHGSELSSYNREMPPGMDLTLEVNSAGSNTPFRTPDVTPFRSDVRNESFASAQTSLLASPDRSEPVEEDSASSATEPTVVEPEPTTTVVPAPSGTAPPPRPPAPESLPPMTDEEILRNWTITDLTTGVKTTLDNAEKIAGSYVDPLSKHLQENHGYDADYHSDSDNSSYVPGSSATINTIDDDRPTQSPAETPKSRAKLKSFVKKGKKGVKGMSKGVKNLSKSMRVHKKENESAAEWEVQSGDITVYPNPSYKNYKSENQKFNVIELQSISKAHVKAIWVMKMSPGGKVLASAGDDKNINIWVLKSLWNTFVEKYYLKNKNDIPPERKEPDDSGYFESVPFRVFKGSEGPIIDLSWSNKLYFLLSAGTDKNVRLWHIARQIQIACFPHPDVVPTVVFHPFSDVLFLSGCLDGRVKLWNIHARKVQSHYKLEKRNNNEALITAVNFITYGEKKVRAFVGTFDGRITVLDITASNTLDYHMSFDIRGNRSSNARKITSIEQRPNSANILITSNDSRIRLYDVDHMQITCKYKGFLNVSSQIKASFSHDGNIIISGDEKNFCYFWETETHYKLFNHASNKGPLKRQLRRDKNDCYHRFRSHESRVTCAMFAPQALSDNEALVKEIFVTSDAKGNIKCFLNIRNRVQSP